MAYSNSYKLPWHIRQYVKQELLDYKRNKQLLNGFNVSTRTLLLAEKRIKSIENVLNRLNEEDREIADIIFIEQYSQAGAEVAHAITKAMYYNCMNKVIYLTAKELELI